MIRVVASPVAAGEEVTDRGKEGKKEPQREEGRLDYSYILLPAEF
jgi:hypothetical protein